MQLRNIRICLAWALKERLTVSVRVRGLKSGLRVLSHVFGLTLFGLVESRRMYSLTHFLWLVAARGLIKRVTWKSPVQRQSPSRQVLWLVSLLKIRSLQWVKSQMKLLATLRYYYQKAVH